MEPILHIDHFEKNSPDFETKFAKFYKLRNSGGEVYIAKVIKKKYESLFFDDVYKTIKESKNSAILKIHDIKNSVNQKYTILEYFEGRTLKEWLQESNKISKDEILRVVHSIGEGLDRLHNAGIVHLDLVGNILVNDKFEIKIIDYDHCKKIDNENLKSIDIMSFSETVLRILLFFSERKSTQDITMTYSMDNMSFSSCTGFLESLRIS